MLMSFRRVRLGTALQTAIHAALDVVPMPRARRVRIKSCAGCARRRRYLDNLTRPKLPTVL